MWCSILNRILNSNCNGKDQGWETQQVGDQRSCHPRMHHSLGQACAQHRLQEACPTRHQGDPQVCRAWDGNQRCPHRYPPEQAHLVQGYQVCVSAANNNNVNIVCANIVLFIIDQRHSAFACAWRVAATTMRTLPTNCTLWLPTCRCPHSRTCRRRTLRPPKIKQQQKQFTPLTINTLIKSKFN